VSNRLAAAQVTEVGPVLISVRLQNGMTLLAENRGQSINPFEKVYVEVTQDNHWWYDHFDDVPPTFVAEIC